MSYPRRFFRLAARWGLLGHASGVVSCGMVESRILYVVREQKTFDHIVWPGLVFALIVILPLSRLARDGWLRTAAAMVASCAAYPIAWYIAASTTPHPGGEYLIAFAFSGFLGSLVLSSVLLFGRPGWLRTACATVVVGTAIGVLMGAHLLATVKGVVSLGSAGDILATYMVLWQAAVSVALGRGVLPRPEKAAAPNGAPDAEVDNSRAREGPPSLS
jgi:hypothetical protein